MKTSRLIFLFALLAAAVACVETDSEYKFAQRVYYLVAGGRIFETDAYGSRTRLEFAEEVDLDLKFIHFLLKRDALAAYVVTEDYEVLELNLEDGMMYPKTRLDEIKSGSLIDLRLGWADGKLYALGGDTTTGVNLIEEADVLFTSELDLTGDLDSPVEGCSRPVAFDIAPGGTSAWILYGCGKLMAKPLYGEDGAAEEIADFGPGAMDVQVFDNGDLLVAGTRGLFLREDGSEIRLVSSPGPLDFCRARDKSLGQAWVKGTDQSVYLVEVASGRFALHVENPDLVTSLAPAGVNWTKNTAPVIEGPFGATVYYLTIPNPLQYSFRDPEGELADVTITIESAPSPGVTFVSNGSTALFFDDAFQGTLFNAAFYGGTAPGELVIDIEIISSDGQTSTRRSVLDIAVPPGP